VYLIRLFAMLWPIDYIQYKRTRRIGRIRVALRKLILPWIQFVPFWQARNVIWRMCGAKLHPTVWIARNALLDEETLELITIEEGVRVSYGSMLITHSDLDKEVGTIHIGRQAWIGAGTIILPGVTVGAYSVVGAGSLVNKDVPEDTRVAGVPARIIKPHGVPREWVHVTDRNYDEFVGTLAAHQNSVGAASLGQLTLAEHRPEETSVSS
jgi:serine acetyltransferase